MRTQLTKLKSNALVIVVMGVVIFAASSAGATASKLITGKQIKDQSITGKDIKNGSISRPDLKPGIVGADGGLQPKSTAAAPSAPAAIPPTSWHAYAGDGQSTMSGSFIPLVGSKVQFTTTAASTLIRVQLGTTCTTGHGPDGWIEIRVDGVATTPGEEIACNGGPVRFSTERIANVGAGSHTIQTYFRDDSQNAGTGVNLSQTLLVATDVS